MPQVFSNDDASYRAWVSANPGGLVVNANRIPNAGYVKLHRASCIHITDWVSKNPTSTGFIKICGDTRAELDAWAQSTVNGPLQPCLTCMNGPARSPGTRAPSQPTARPRPATSPASTRPGEAPSLILNSGLQLDEPQGRLLKFCEKEFAYYDGIPDTDPNHVLPVDVLATLMMNSNILRSDPAGKGGFENDADKIRRLHQDLAKRCDPWLRRIPADADLRTFNPDLDLLMGMIAEAIEIRGVGIAVATKTLFRKRPGLIPMLDSVVVKAYRDVAGLSAPDWRLGPGPEIASITEVVKMFRTDLIAASPRLENLRVRLATDGYPLTPLRCLEILLWIEHEKHGYYRNRSL